eukprot:CFRG1319T1
MDVPQPEATAVPVPQFAVRSLDALEVFQHGQGGVNSKVSPPIGGIRCMKWSPDGAYLAYSANGKVVVFSSKDWSVKMSIAHANVNKMFFSPTSTTLITYARYETDKNHQGKDNMKMWHVKESSSDEIEPSLSAVQRGDAWTPVMSLDGELFGKIVTNTVQFYNLRDLKTGIVRKLHLEGVNKFSLSGGKDTHVAAFVPTKKGQPARVNIYRYPNLEKVVATKSFFKADTVDMSWNSTGTALLIHTHVHVDQSNKSYYGENKLYFISADGSTSCNVELGKEGPIYSTEWNPNGKDFTCVFGFMPAKAMLFNDKCKAVMDFGTGKRNLVSYSPSGHAILLSGFGNLRGEMEFWDRKKLRLVSKFQAPDTTTFEWCPDNEHFITATLSPRLREDNGFKIWHYNGTQVSHVSYKELYEVSWKPQPKATYEEKACIGVQPNAKAKVQAESKPAAYRPPGARNTVNTNDLHSDAHEKAQRLDIEPTKKMVLGAGATLSKAALKNKKKREAAKARALEETTESGIANKASVSVPEVAVPVVPQTTEDLSKRLRNLKKKMRQIDQLIEQQKTSELEATQVEKISGRDDISKEIEDVEKSLAAM